MERNTLWSSSWRLAVDLERFRAEALFFSASVDAVYMIARDGLCQV
jgi:hypothetical protein